MSLRAGTCGPLPAAPGPPCSSWGAAVASVATRGGGGGVAGAGAGAVASSAAGLRQRPRAASSAAGGSAGPAEGLPCPPAFSALWISGDPRPPLPLCAVAPTLPGPRARRPTPLIAPLRPWVFSSSLSSPECFASKTPLPRSSGPVLADSTCVGGCVHPPQAHHHPEAARGS